MEHELPPAVDFLQHGVAGDVAGKKVGGELNPLGFQAERLRKALDELRLSEPGQALEQDMPPGEQPAHHQFDQVILPKQHLAQRFAQTSDMLPRGRNLRIRCVVCHRPQNLVIPRPVASATLGIESPSKSSN